MRWRGGRFRELAEFPNFCIGNDTSSLTNHSVFAPDPSGWSRESLDLAKIYFYFTASHNKGQEYFGRFPHPLLAVKAAKHVSELPHVRNVQRF